MYFDAPYEPHDPTDKSGLSYDTVVRRWPVILTGVIDQIYRENHLIHDKIQEENDPQLKESLRARLEEGKTIIGEISKLKYKMGRDHALEPITDDEPHAEVYNKELTRLAESGKGTWFTAPWLFAECYLYRLLRSITLSESQWRTYDPFFDQKNDVFKKSSGSIFRKNHFNQLCRGVIMKLEIAGIMDRLGADKDKLLLAPDELFVLFEDFIQMCLWGNATDLSLLTNISLDDIKNLQSVGKDVARQAFILRDDQAAVWEHVKTLKDARIDFVLDNAGFELFTDLVFADFLVTYTPFVSKVVFHPKLIPWFVSDVTPADFSYTIASLLDTNFFQEASDREKDLLVKMAGRWRTYWDQGVFQLAVPADSALGAGPEKAPLGQFWTTPWPYWDLKLRDRDLWEHLNQSGLVVFKGDLNYRKLTGDIKWPAWTPFAEALGPLAGSFPLLSLRTNKADVAVGIEKEVAERLDDSGEKWRVDGRYALISYNGRSV